MSFTEGRKECTRLNLDSMKYVGLIDTRSANSIITDSAAAGTALATGHKTNNGMVGMLPNGRSVQNIREVAVGLGKATGMVTNRTIVDATPAVFGAHVPKRSDELDIVDQYLNNRIDLLLGGGRNFFIPKSIEGSRRFDEKDMRIEAGKLGYTVVEDRAELMAVKSGKILGLFHANHMTGKYPEPSLSDMTYKAIKTLSDDPDGFFLMVEGGNIDHEGHGNNAPDMVRELRNFDAAVGRALYFARMRGDTLVVVAADHETGGLIIIGKDNKHISETAEPRWVTKGHTATNVILFAEGPGAELFTGVMDNTDVPKRLVGLWGVKGFADGR